MKHIIFYSSGLSSFYAAKRVIDQYGSDNVTLLFSDTMNEDSDNYRFLNDSVKLLGANLITVVNEKFDDFFDVWDKNKAIPNNRMSFCSRELKIVPARNYLKQFDPNDTTLYLGIAWDEIHRIPAIEKNWKPFETKFPLTDPPYLDRLQMINGCLVTGLEPPRMYALGFQHANCGGGCVRSGIAHWVHTLKVFPNVYKIWERKEQEMRDKLGKDITILRKQRNSIKQPYTLKELREDIESDNSNQLDLFDWGGCGCFIDDQS